MKIQIAPSILAGDFANLSAEIRRVEASGADMVHVDVMDGHFVDNLTIGPPVVAALRKHTKLPLDVHLMIENPDRYLPKFLDAGADLISFHLEALALPDARRRVEKGFTFAASNGRAFDVDRACRIIEQVRAAGRRAAAAINPDTMIEILDNLPLLPDMVLVMTVWPGFGGQSYIDRCSSKVRALRSRHPNLDIQVDGGVNPETVERAAAAGANVFVAGTATFQAPDFNGAVRELRSRAEKAFRG